MIQLAGRIGGLSVPIAVLVFSSASAVVNAADSEWTRMHPTPAPSARVGHDMAYDAESHRVILFGGMAPESDILNGETWAYDLKSNVWENRNPSPSPSNRFAQAMVYDSNSDRVVLFGGWTGTKQSTETWAYDYDKNTWTNMTPTTSPQAGVFAEMAYDAESDRAILFGGVADREGGAGSAETWAYDFNSNQWSKRGPSTSPAVRGSHGMAYDPSSDRVILFGGRADYDFGDTWAYDYNTDTWTEKSPVTSPSARHGLTMADGTRSSGAILFGGVTVTGDTTGGDETWIYNFHSNNWTMVERGYGPSKRYGAPIVYITGTDRFLLFGGTDGGDETWSLHFVAKPAPASFPWANIAAWVMIGAVVAFLMAVLIRRGRGGEGRTRS